MTRNIALRLMAWLIVLTVAAGTPIGAILLSMTKTVITGHWTAVWLIVGAALTLLAVLLGRIFVTLWGDVQAVQR